MKIVPRNGMYQVLHEDGSKVVTQLGDIAVFSSRAKAQRYLDTHTIKPPKPVVKQASTRVTKPKPLPCGDYRVNAGSGTVDRVADIKWKGKNGKWSKTSVQAPVAPFVDHVLTYEDGRYYIGRVTPSGDLAYKSLGTKRMSYASKEAALSSIEKGTPVPPPTEKPAWTPRSYEQIKRDEAACGRRPILGLREK